MVEEIRGIFRGYRIIGKGLFPRKWECKLYFTTDRLIIDKETGLKSRLSGQLKGALDYYLFLHASTKDKLKMNELYNIEKYNNILKSNEENFEINYSDIKVIELLGGKEIWIFIEDLEVPKYKFHIFIRTRYKKDFQTFLNTILPDKI